jgi:hypothetical protein
MQILFVYQRLYVSYNVLSDNGLGLHIVYLFVAAKEYAPSIYLKGGRGTLEAGQSSYKYSQTISMQRWAIRK